MQPERVRAGAQGGSVASGRCVAFAAEKRKVEKEHGVVYRVNRQAQSGSGVGEDACEREGGDEKDTGEFLRTISHRGTETTEGGMVAEGGGGLSHGRGDHRARPERRMREGIGRN